MRAVSRWCGVRAQRQARVLVTMSTSALLLAACDVDEGSASYAPRRCDVLWETQVRLGERIRSPTPEGFFFGAYPIVEGNSVMPPGTSACAVETAARLDEACDECSRRPGGCEDLVRSIFATPIGACTACGDGVCLEGEDADNCPQDCQARCGDGVCAQSESELLCPRDCAQACGDGVCAAGESPQSCPQDCNYTVGNGRCEPGETPVNSPADCQGATCGDGYCQSYETTLLCATDCCRPSLCNQDARVCIDGNTIGRCQVRGLGGCPDVVDAEPCAFGCRTTVVGVDCAPDEPFCGEAACRTCEEVARGTVLDAMEDAVFDCAVGERCARRVSASQPDVAGRPVEDHLVIRCEPVAGFAGCTVGRVEAYCMPQESCDDGACVDCEALARASGAYDFDTRQWVLGCTPGGAGAQCEVGLRTAAHAGTPHDLVVADCEVVPGTTACTIGELVADCGASAVEGPLCEGAECVTR